MAQFTSIDFWLGGLAPIALQWALDPLRRPLLNSAENVIGFNAVILFLLVSTGWAPLSGNQLMDCGQSLALAGCYWSSASLLPKKKLAFLAYIPWAIVAWSYGMAIRLNIPNPAQGALGIFPLIICAITTISMPLVLLSRVQNSSSSNA